MRRNFMLSFQYWLGGSPENLENFFLMLADRYVITDRQIEGAPQTESLDYQEPVTYPDMGIWHPMAPHMFEDIKEYLNWHASRRDISEDLRDPLAPTIGLVLQRTHLVTGDEAHYVAMVQEFEYLGARVIPVFAGGLDFSKPVDAYFFDPVDNTKTIVDAVVSLTGFALVGGPARKITPRRSKPSSASTAPTWWRCPWSFKPPRSGKTATSACTRFRWRYRWRSPSWMGRSSRSCSRVAMA
jgi:magnesium chelatase subunit H